MFWIIIITIIVILSIEAIFIKKKYGIRKSQKGKQRRYDSGMFSLVQDKSLHEYVDD